MLLVFVGCVVLKILDLFSGTLAKTSVYSLRRGLMLLEFSGCVFLKIFNLFFRHFAQKRRISLREGFDQGERVDPICQNAGR